MAQSGHGLPSDDVGRLIAALSNENKRLRVLLYEAERCLDAWHQDAINRGLPDDDASVAWTWRTQRDILRRLRNGDAQ